MVNTVGNITSTGPLAVTIFPATDPSTGLRGATVARLTPDQKVACSNHVGVSTFHGDLRLLTGDGGADVLPADIELLGLVQALLVAVPEADHRHAGKLGRQAVQEARRGQLTRHVGAAETRGGEMG